MAESWERLEQDALSIKEVFAGELRALAAIAPLAEAVVVQRKPNGRAIVGGRAVVDFSSDNYLGLAADARLAAAAASALLNAPVGASGAPRTAGRHPFHKLLEHEIAQYFGAESALLFGSGYLANLGCLRALVGTGDVVYCDEMGNRALVEGVHLSGAHVRVFPHRSIDDLRRLLVEDAGKFRRRLIAVESLFGLHGNLFPLDRLVEVAREHRAWTYVDDSHATGILGARGRGAPEHFGVEGEIDVVVSTFGKALGSSGGFAFAKRTLVEYLAASCEQYLATTASPPPITAAALEALHIVETDRRLRTRLHENAQRLWARLSAVVARERLVSGSHSVKYIVPVILSESRDADLPERLLRRGFLVGSVVPRVAGDLPRLRLTVSSTHNEADIDDLAQAVGEELRKEA
ncbi:MAG TPA: aminotransferase class I/II-fold pyridoxal phosphate-dependent enzyme [Gemmatimonadaceae bacterium]|nr:aminotransferase class I/II-fold pyridoxal phosphate-dependent enzyme [Gemmatimonadaceae bacterium]